jgi:hypothetical protein
MKSLRARLTKLGTLLGGVALLWACNAPPIVVPPPAVAFTSTIVTDASGGQRKVWTAAQPQPFSQAADARFYLYDLNTGAGVIQTADGQGMFTTTPAMDGNDDDHVFLYYQTPGGDYSDSICLLLRVVAAPGLAPFCP